MKRRYAAMILGLTLSMVSLNVCPAFAAEEETEDTLEEADEEEEYGEEDEMEVIGQVTEVGPDYVTIATGFLDSDVVLGDLDLEALLAESGEEDSEDEIEVTVSGGQVLELDGIEETYEVDENALLYQLAEPYTDIEVADGDMESEEEPDEELGDEEEIAVDPEEEEITISLGDEEELDEADTQEDGEEAEEDGEEEEVELISITLDDILEGDIVSISATEEGYLFLTVLQKGDGEEYLEEEDLEEVDLEEEDSEEEETEDEDPEEEP